MAAGCTHHTMGLRTAIWGKSPLDPVERRLLLKLDWFILLYVCLVYWINYLDRLNLANAYVLGMQEDLAMKGNEFNIINTCFSVGYIVALVPHNLIMLKVKPRYWLTFCLFAWGVLTLLMYKATLWKQLAVIRFFLAVFEAVTFSGTHLILGSFYSEELLPFRTAVFTSSGLIGLIFSLVMAAAIHNNMDGFRGLAGWRWLFIVDFLVTLPVVFYGFVFFPDSPSRGTKKPFYLTQQEYEVAIEKRRVPTVNSFGWLLLRRVFGLWQWWMFSVLWVLGGENELYATNSLFALWLKHFGYSVEDRNHYPMGIFAVGVVATLALAVYINLHRGYWHVGLLIGVVLIVLTALLAAAPRNAAYVFPAHYLLGVSYAGQTVFFGWANVITQHDIQLRAIVLALMNMFSSAVNAWWSILFYAADTAPDFRRGVWAMLGTAVASMIVVVAIRRLEKAETPEEDEAFKLQML